MQWNILELAENGRYIKLYRGFLIVMQDEEELGRVVIDELSCLLLSADQATLSKQVIVRLAEEGIPIVICGKNYHPASICLPYASHHQFSKILQCQISVSTPLKKRLWQQLVITKIRHQKYILEKLRSETSSIKQLDRMISKVRSGDPDNIEAQAAVLYWPSLFGEEFRRRAEAENPINAALNYGYSVLRGACARATVAAGLTPALGIHHTNQNNPFCLIDDLMEVYRPLVDQLVFHMLPALEDNLQSDHKRKLVKILQADIKSDGSLTTVSTSMQNLAFSLVKSYQNKEVTLITPELL